eukprot:TRINITY_DN6785_c2_g1_i1.p1 TRINITY_DN6785_c2_g1~~TRINITY_DN6785_c2_g1_i1.p1  ORF type:complete len:224 (+),score=45.15 TRINITY_DN6785_c2_g1_i1:43-714(+)
MNSAISSLLGIAFALLIGILMGGEDRVEKHARMAASSVGFELPDKKVTAEELSKNTNAVSIGGVVFDVSASGELYGESGWYKYLTAKDATVVFGTGIRIGYTFDPNLNEADPSRVTEDTTDNVLSKICHYLTLFHQKYPKIGILTDGAYFKEDGTPTDTKVFLNTKCSTLKHSSHEEGSSVGDDVFDEEVNERPTKCPVMKAKKAVKKVADDISNAIQKLIAG